MDFFNHLPQAIRDAEEIQRRRLYVGVPIGNDFLTMVALVQENGAHIRAKNYPFLWIPTSNAQGRKASEIPGLYTRVKQGADHGAAGYDDNSQPYGFRVCFVLKKSVDIPARPFIEKCTRQNIRVWASLITRKATQVMLGQVAINDYYTIIGTRITNDLKQTLHELTQPKNAPLTVERKGKDDPLVDTGRLEKALTYRFI